MAKVPRDPTSGGRAKCDDPATWETRAQAERWAKRHVNGAGGGVGIQLGDIGNGETLVGIDLDTCRNPDGSFEPWAEDILELLGTYTEVSPSSTGAKAFCRLSSDDAARVRTAMDRPNGRRWAFGPGKHPPGIEIAIGGKYFTVTGQYVATTPTDIRLVHAQVLERLITWADRKRGTPTAAPGLRQEADVPGDELFTRIEAAARHDATLARHWRGDWTGVQDNSRSGKAFALGKAMKRAGFTKSDAFAALGHHHDTAEWSRAAGQRGLERIWANAPGNGENVRPGGSPDDPLVLPPEHSEDALALELAERHSDELSYVPKWHAWVCWDRGHWDRDELTKVYDIARVICREHAAMAESREKNGAATAKALASSTTVAGVVRLAQSDPALTRRVEAFDADPWLLNTPGGTVELRSGTLRSHRREDLITKATTVSPADIPDCPAWLRFLDEATQHDTTLIRFLQQWCGYTLTGVTTEHALLFLYGPGGNGKSVFLNTVFRILGTYARMAAMETFTASAHDRHPTDLAMLHGARMVAASETEEGRPWAETRIKALTGGDPISARFMRGDFFTFTPQLKLVVVGNHKPVLRNVDEAARRRFNIVPFVHRPENPDRDLEARLLAEAPAILRWMIEGCLDWQRNGLVRPDVVLDATAEYFSEQDLVRQWIETCCDTGGRNLSDTSANLFKAWSAYALANGEKPGTAKWFSQNLIRQGFEPYKDRSARGFKGIAVKLTDTANQWQNRDDR